MILRSACFAFLLGTTSALASAPKVVTDIPPVQSLVAMVMGEIGTPDALVEAGASPHDLTLRPSQAQSLSRANIVIWIGPQLSPSLADQLEILAPDAMHMALIDVEGAHHLPYRENALFEHDHGEEHDDHDDKHAEHDDHEEHDEHHEKEEDGHDEHHHDAPEGGTAIDPHLWLSPENAIVWLPHIAQALASIDQDNSAVYLNNAAEAVDQVKAAQARALATLTPAKDTPLAAYHDAFQYYEEAFGLHVLGAISDSDAAQPGPKRIDMLRTAFETNQPVCFLMEPSANERLLTSVGWDEGAAPIARIDPLGGTLEKGPGLYPALIEDIATRIAACAKEQ